MGNNMNMPPNQNGKVKNKKTNQINKMNKVKKKRSLISKFFITLATILGVFVVACGMVVLGYSYFNGVDADVSKVAKAIESNLKQGGSLSDIFSGVKEHTNFLVLGTDGDGGGTAHTDIMMVGTFNSKTGRISLISIPRDTYVVMPKERLQILKDNGMNTASSSGIMKLTEVSHHAGPKFNTEFTAKQIEEMLGIEIEYYVKVDLDAFKYIIDKVDGIEFDVPIRMYYRDPGQNLYIDLKPGLQTLNGTQAEGLVRYRKEDALNPLSKGYAEGDVGRVKTQQAFMKAFISQVASKDSIMGNWSAYLDTFLNYVDTNFPVTDAPKYMQYIKNIKAENIDTYTLPGEEERASPNGKWYFITDEAAAAELIDEIFYSTGEQKKAAPPVSSKGKKIQVLNGGYTKGLASTTQEMLEAEGFTVSDIGDYEGTKKDYTRIMVKDGSLGADLLPFFEGGKIVVDKSVKNVDIVIVIGEPANN